MKLKPWHISSLNFSKNVCFKGCKTSAYHGSLRWKLAVWERTYRDQRFLFTPARENKKMCSKTTV